VASVSAIRAAVVAMAVMSMAMAMVVSGFMVVTCWGVICVVLQLFLCGNKSVACGGLQLYL
jgi:membrane-bound ClpP family serine protease